MYCLWVSFLNTAEILQILYDLYKLGNITVAKVTAECNSISSLRCLVLLDSVSRDTVIAWASVIHLSFSATAALIQAKFCGKLPIHFFLLSKFSVSKLLQFFFAFVNIRPFGSENFKKVYFSHSFHFYQTL